MERGMEGRGGYLFWMNGASFSFVVDSSAVRVEIWEFRCVIFVVREFWGWFDFMLGG